MEWILQHYANYPIFLVYDYDIPPPLKQRTPTGESGEDFDFYWQQQVTGRSKACALYYLDIRSTPAAHLLSACHSGKTTRGR